MSEIIENPEKSPYKKVISINPGETFTLSTKEGFSSAIIGRDPVDFGRSEDVRIPEDCLGVKLEGTSNRTTSRLQLKIRRNSIGNFYIKNLSELIPLNTESSLRGKQVVEPLRHVVIGNKAEQFEGLKVEWFSNTLEAKVSGDPKGEDWEVKFTYSR